MKKYFAKILILFCFALLNININAAIITKIINNSDTEVTLEFYENHEYIDECHLTINSKTKIIPRPGFIFPENTKHFCSLIEYGSPKSGRRSPGLIFSRDNVPNYLKIITKLGIFYLAQGQFVPDPSDQTVISSFWKQQLGKTATKTMGKFFVNIIIIVDNKGDIQFFEDRPDFEN